MSSSEGENFDFDVSGSESEEDYTPVKKVRILWTTPAVAESVEDYHEEGCSQSSSQTQGSSGEI